MWSPTNSQPAASNATEAISAATVARRRLVANSQIPIGSTNSLIATAAAAVPTIQRVCSRLLQAIANSSIRIGVTVPITTPWRTGSDPAASAKQRMSRTPAIHRLAPTHAIESTRNSVADAGNGSRANGAIATAAGAG